MVQPNDSVFNTRIDTLPVNSNSSTWNQVTQVGITFEPTWGLNIIDNTVPMTASTFYYTYLNNGNFQLPARPNRFRETGSLTTDGNNDHHMISVNHQTCQFYETYQEGDAGLSNNVTANSGWQYNGASYAAPPSNPYGGGSTDAASLPLEPLTLHLSDIKSGHITHAMRFTLCGGCINANTYLWPAQSANGGNVPTAPPMGTRFRLKANFNVSGIYQLALTNNGTGYTSAPTISFTGCQTSPVATAVVSGGSVQGVTLKSTGAGCVNPTVSFSGPGTGATAAVSTFLPIAQTVLTALQQYGMILADNGTSGLIQTSSDVNRDAAVVAALTQITNARIAFSNFEAVDESSLMVSPTSFQVNPANGYVTPANYAVLTATDASGNKTRVPVAIQPVTVGTQYTTMTFFAGAPAYQIPARVNGTTNSALTWALTGPGSLSSAGVYTPPATIAAITPVQIVATSVADPTASVTIWGTVAPVDSQGALRIDVGNTNTYTDSNGNVWQPDAVASEMATFNSLNDNYPSNAWGNIPDAALWQTYKYTWGDDLIFGPFVVPNGNYKIGYYAAVGECAGTFSTQPQNNGLVNGLMALEAQGAVQDYFNIANATSATCRVPAMMYFPATVTNNVLYFAVRATGAVNAHSSPTIAAYSIIPDSTPAHLAVDTDYVTDVTAGSTVQLYAVGWYMSNAVTWSVSGGGTIDQHGLYTAPATAPATNQTITITATSTVNPSMTATATITFDAGG
jgi:hypothetical protein